MYLESIDDLQRALAAANAKAPFLVVSSAAYEHCDSRIESRLGGARFEVFDDFEPNPTLEDVLRGLAKARPFQPDAIIAIGGGTAMDIGKLIGLSLPYEDAQLPDLFRGKIEKSQPSLPIIAVPTTAGSGSEATHFAVVYIDGEKQSVVDRSLQPLATIVDPSLSATLPPDITAECGLDALCQGAEAIWAVAGDADATRYGEEAIQLAAKHLENAVLRPDETSRAGMALAAYRAGQAINISRTTACHALSYKITTTHGLPHGRAVAMTLVPVLEFNAAVTDEDALDPRGAEYTRGQTEKVVAAAGCESLSEFGDWFRSLQEKIGAERTLEAAAGGREIDIEMLAKSVNGERLSNNPRQMTHEILRGILESVRRAG